jgi:hypothetical protein
MAIPRKPDGSDSLEPTVSFRPISEVLFGQKALVQALVMVIASALLSSGFRIAVFVRRC